MNSFTYLYLLSAIVVLTSANQAKWHVPMVQIFKNGTSGVSNKISGQIISGAAASLGQFPWQASLLLAKGTQTFLCGGSLIHPQWVLTAAHCTTGATSATVRLGTLIFSSGSAISVTNASSIITHASYSSTNMNNDLGLIYLPSPVNITTNVATIKLVPTTMVFSALTVSGWGKTCDTCGTSTTLNYAVVSAITNTQCSNFYGTAMITNNSVCTIGNPKQSPCSGDSGGPLVITGATPYLVGVISFVSGMGCELCTPSGYVRIANYCSWLQSNIAGYLCS